MPGICPQCAYFADSMRRWRYRMKAACRKPARAAKRACTNQRNAARAVNNMHVSAWGHGWYVATSLLYNQCWASTCRSLGQSNPHLPVHLSLLAPGHQLHQLLALQARCKPLVSSCFEWMSGVQPPCSVSTL
jgi:hypothetical protein